MFNPFRKTEMSVEEVRTKENELSSFIDDMLKRKVEVKTEDEPKTETEEWIWVEGYKGTEGNMTCRGYQYELNKRFDMSYGEEISICESGFHFSKKLENVFDHYSIGAGHRFFKVRGLVRKSDYENISTNVAVWHPFGPRYKIVPDKLAAMSIEFISELSADEILAASDVDVSDWTEDEKKLALAECVMAVEVARKREELLSLGFSRELVDYIEHCGCLSDALRIARIPDIDKDTKVWLIFKDE